MRRLRLLPIVLLAACGPRAVLGHGHGVRAPSDATTLASERNGATPGADAARSSAPLTGTSLLDTPLTSANLLDARLTTVSAAGSGSSVTTNEPAREPPSGIVISRLPAPHRVAAVEAPAPRTVADAFALVGHRDSREPVAFALAIAASLGGDVPAFAAGPTAAPGAVTDGPTLVAWAEERAAFMPAIARVAPGDLLVFDRAAANEPASLIGVALETDARGVTAFLYLARGVVRIGHLDPARPTIARDREGRTVNSYIRHTTDYPPAGTRYLAGELLAGSIRMR